MPTVRLLNWNIQNFGPTKAGSKFGNYDIVQAIAKFVVTSEVDIFVMVEMNTMSRGRAEDLALIMLDALQEASPNRGEWTQVVLSPNTGREFYAFFIRDCKFTTPAPLTGPIVPQYGEPPQIFGQRHPIASAQFSLASTSLIGVLDAWFPLLAPDQPELDVLGYSMGVPPWPAVRRPALGLFKIRGASRANAYLPIVVCHYAPKATVAIEQFNALPYFSFLSGLAPSPPARMVKLNIDGVLSQPAYWLLTGDFNVDYNSFDYRKLTGNQRRALGAKAAIHENTMLVTYNQYSPRDYKTTESLAVKNFDNWLVSQKSITVRATRPAVEDIPGLVRTRTIKLHASVQHYQELDQRGFKDQPYLEVTQNYADQLTNWTTDINTPGALMGGRLISDHLPALIDLTVT